MRAFLFVLLLAGTLVTDSHACTGITLKVNGKKTVFGRTLEFAKGALEYSVSLVPRNYKFTGTTPDNRPGLQWKGQYGYVAFTPPGSPNMFSGLNEKGLSYNTFYLPGYTEYQKYNPKDADRTIAPIELGTWIMTNFSSVKEVRENINKIIVADVIFPAIKIVPPLHAAVIDKDGNFIVIEYIKGKLHIFDNPFGVITNSPNFDWHMTNIKNYINIRPKNINPVTIDGKTLEGLGCGTGSLGLPGDTTPPSRFVRALFMSANSTPSQNAEEAVFKAFHILNNFDIPEGTVMDDFNGKWGPEITQWTSVTDLQNLRFFFHLRDNREIRMLDLKKLNFNSKKIKVYKLPEKETVIDISESLK